MSAPQVLQAPRRRGKWGKAPAWAIRLAQEVCTEARVEQPKIIWRRSPMIGSPGSYLASRQLIRLTAGCGMGVPDRTGHKITLLHELAHHINETRGGKGHDATFWDIAFGLYVRHRVARLALPFEAEYRAGAIPAARAHGVPGVRAAASSRKASR